MKRNLSIDIMRVIGAIAVASCHSTYLTNPRSIPLIFPSGYIAVEFFFILTGYFMVEHSMKVKSSDIGEGSILFITKKIASILPYYLFAWIMSLIIIHLPNNFHFYNILSTISKSIGPTLFLDMFGIGGFAIVGSTWYISAMIIALAILYPVLLYNNNIFIYLSPFISCLYMDFYIKIMEA